MRYFLIGASSNTIELRPSNNSYRIENMFCMFTGENLNPCVKKAQDLFVFALIFSEYYKHLKKKIKKRAIMKEYNLNFIEQGKSKMLLIFVGPILYFKNFKL